MTADSALANDHVDAQALAVARAVLDGSIPERDARWRLAGMVNEVRIPLDVARSFLRSARWTGSAPGVQETTDLADRLRVLLVTKVAPREDGSGTVSFHRLAEGASFCAFLRAYAATAVRSEYRNMARVPAPLFSPYWRDPDAVERELRPLHSSLDFSTPDADRAEWELTVFLARAKHQRPLRLAHERWRAVRSALELPDPGRPATAEDQAELDSQLVDESVAYAYVRALLAGRKVGADGAAGPMSVVWSTYTDTDLLTLVEHAPVVAHAAAKAAATPAPPPHRSAVIKLQAEVAEVAEGAGRRFVPLMEELVAAWSAARSEIVGDEYNQWRPKPSAVRASDREAFARAVQGLVDAGFTLFGQDPAGVARMFDERLDRIETSLALRAG